MQVAYLMNTSRYVSRIVDDQLEEIARILLDKPFKLLWVSTRLLVCDSSGVVELNLKRTQLEHRAQSYSYITQLLHVRFTINFASEY